MIFFLFWIIIFLFIFTERLDSFGEKGIHPHVKVVWKFTTGWENKTEVRINQSQYNVYAFVKKKIIPPPLFVSFSGWIQLYLNSFFSTEQ